MISFASGSFLFGEVLSLSAGVTAGTKQRRCRRKTAGNGKNKTVREQLRMELESANDTGFVLSLKGSTLGPNKLQQILKPDGTKTASSRKKPKRLLTMSTELNIITF